MQAGLLKTEGVKDYLNIPKAPAEAPTLKMRNPFSSIFEVYGIIHRHWTVCVVTFKHFSYTTFLGNTERKSAILYS